MFEFCWIRANVQNVHWIAPFVSLYRPHIQPLISKHTKIAWQLYTYILASSYNTGELEYPHLIYMLTIDLICESNLIDFTHFWQIHKELNAFHVLKINLHWITASYLLDLFTLSKSTLHELQTRDHRDGIHGMNVESTESAPGEIGNTL